MDERNAIERYDRAGETRPAASGVRWPDLALDAANLSQLSEGVLETHFDFARLAFGAEFEPAALTERLTEAWRTEAVHARYAPEGVFVHARFTVCVRVEPEREEPAEDALEEVLRVEAELCVSFTARHHTRPFVDFMHGEVQRESDGACHRLDPFAMEVSPEQAIAWGLNGC